jgi:hypothetical protein
MVLFGMVLLGGLAVLLVMFCFSGNVRRQEVAGGSDVDNAEALALAAKKAKPAPLIELTPKERHQVDDALARGIAFLKQSQSPDGGWNGESRAGYTALAGLTLVECGLPVEDPCIKKAAAFMRNACPQLNRTYDISLAILFLIRLADSADRERIQQLALQLVAGQMPSGGWSYGCPTMNQAAYDKLLELLRDLKLNDPDNLHRAQAVSKVQIPPEFSNLTVLRDPPNQPDEFFRNGGDNSNSQFAILALWAARGQGLPLDRTLALMVRRFRATQNPNGSWDYDTHRIANMQGNPTMTCAGLLGVAVGHGLAADGGKQKERPGQDDAIKKAVEHVAQSIHFDPKATNPPQPNLQPDMYFLWSVERVAVLYQLKTVGDKHWYHWGMQLILPRQDMKDGGWLDGGGYGATRTINTCFAMLFLKRVNLAKDLTDKINEMLAAGPGQPARKD